MTRKEVNTELLNTLEYLIEKYPEQRFSQILQNFGFVKPNRPANDLNRIDWQNEFYLEGGQVLERVLLRIKDIEEVK